ncbi:hypothetical protein ACFVTY_06040 [Streptomyces sp. NPDC058067]|uniref:hypothetical protein n=1 Tax=Streptomyces sp. NPDC058067 TaxID=3346324 RepID=UPI0036E10E29
MLVQSAVAGTVADQITEHADDLFGARCARREAAWQEAAALLTQFVLSGGHYGTGDGATDRYLAQQPDPSPEMPMLTALHGLNAACIRRSPDAAKGFLLTQPDWIVGARTGGAQGWRLRLSSARPL